ncbi:MAG: beta-propeller fold lactonase family protein [Gallionella sp.]|nr:beta-propeller fold lactonase family protein [Gallionella sp.]
MHINHTKLIHGALFLASVFLTACGGGGGGAAAPATTYTIGGSISGLAGTVVLQNNGGDNLSISTGASTFTFSTALASGNYVVTVLTQPAGQTCTASSNSGTVAGANVTNVAVICSANTYTIGGTISGLAGTVVLQNNGGDTLSRSASGSFVFSAPVASGAGYAVTVFAQPAGQRCTVTSGGSGSNVQANVTSVAVSCVPVYTIGGTVTGLGSSIGLVLQNTGNNNLSIGGNGAFAFSKGLANGETYNVKVLIQPAAPALTCTVTGSTPATGTVATSAVTVTITCATPIPQFAFVANYNSNDVSAYRITNGVLAAITGSPFSAGIGPRSVTVVPSGKFAYVANINSSDISAYTINAGTGALTQISCVGGTTICNSNNFLAGTNPVAVTVDPSGHFAYVANLNSGDISAYTINATTGALTQISCVGGTTICNSNNFRAGNNPSSVTVDHSGQFAYVANANDDSVSAYTIDAATGALTAVADSPYTAGTGPQSLDIDPTSRFAYVANANGGSVAAYTIDPLTGALVLVSCGAPSSSCDASGHFLAGTTPTSIVVDTTGKYVYVANKISNDISAYSIDNAPGGTGALTQVLCGGGAGCNGNNFQAGASPTSITVDLSGQFVYVANYGTGVSNVSSYTIDGTGALSAIAGSPFAAGTNPASVITTVIY